MILRTCVAVLLLFSVAPAAENIQGHIFYLRMIDQAQASPVFLQGQACDLNSGCGSSGSLLTIKICWDDFTCSIPNNDDTTTANVGTAHNFNYHPVPLPGVNPNDGNRHMACVKAVSPSNPGAGDKWLDGSCWPFKLITAFSGTAIAGTTTSITLPPGAASTANAYLNYTLAITAGTASPTSAHITSYNAATRVATFAAPISVAPDSTSGFTIEAIGPMWDPVLGNGSTRLQPSQLAIFVNAADPYSIGANGPAYCIDPSGVAIKEDGVAGYYGNLYGVPCSNFYLLNGPAGLTTQAGPTVSTQVITQANFASQIMPSIAALPPIIQAIALAFGNPVEVALTAGHFNSVAGMVANGGIAAGGITVPTGADTCAGYIQTQTANPYFNTATSAPFTSYGIRPTMMLVGETYGSNDPRFGPYTFSFSAFQTMVNKSHAAINSNPVGGNVEVSVTPDTVRSDIAWVFSPASQGAGLAPNANGVINGNTVSPFTYALQGTNILGYVVGDLTTTIGAPYTTVGSGVPLIFELTSTSGMLPYDSADQPAAWALNYAGAAGSYGSVTEPCVTLPQQFPDPALWAVNYLQGQTMVEAIWKATQFTALAVPIGDPLAAPFRLTNPGAPSIVSVVNGASFLPVALAPNTWFSVLGTNLGNLEAATGGSATLLGGATVTVCGIPAALSFNNGQGQINALMPAAAALAGQTSCPVLATVNGAASGPFMVSIGQQSLGVFLFSSAGSTLPVATHADYTVIGPAASSLTPAQGGEQIILWCTGWNAGAPNPNVTIGGQTAPVTYYGASGSSPGLCQINVVVPQGLPSGSNALVVGSLPPYPLWLR